MKYELTRILVRLSRILVRITRLSFQCIKINLNELNEEAICKGSELKQVLTRIFWFKKIRIVKISSDQKLLKRIVKIVRENIKNC